MSTSLLLNSAVSAPVGTLAQLRARILADAALSAPRQRDLASALQSLAKGLGRPLDTLPAEPAAVRRLLRGVTAAQMGFQPARWRNIRSLVSAALARTGQIIVPARLDLPPSPAWAALLAQLTSLDTRCRMGRLARYCTRQGLQPEQVDDAVLAAFRTALEQGSLVADPARCQRETALQWNRAATAHPAWPQQRLTVPDHRLYYSPPWSSYPPSLLQDVEAWCAALRGGDGADIWAEGACAQPLRPKTVQNRHARLRLYLGALVLRGEDPADLVDLRAAVTPARVRLALEFFLERAGQKPTHHTAQIAQLALGIARHWAKLPEVELATLQRMTSRVTPPKQGMAPRNQARLRPLQDPGAQDRVFALPADLCSEVVRQERRLGAPNVALARQWQTAVLVELLLVVPMRMANLAGLRIGTQLLRTPQGALFLTLAGEEVKNGQPLECQLPDVTARMIDRYIAQYRPLLGEAGGDWLFPGRQPGRPKSHDALRDQITEVLAERCGVAMHPHLFRHFAGLLTLQREPAAYGLVQRILGHRQLGTTTSFYTGLETPRALQHYHQAVLARDPAAAPARPRRRR
ncbi:site-specific integrase [Roseomonas sp. KE0001]|uniref:site-specific integrase n=1 Tax=Roseomonas sp. KE0001 TaxID=2479201 RepID=UPI0018E00714|nr:site-specific integrase [Roseomonas sp. KE0001]MBI0436013.1 site-specific integrase [Roseomonas sp. KE0001]